MKPCGLAQGEFWTLSDEGLSRPRAVNTNPESVTAPLLTETFALKREAVSTEWATDIALERNHILEDEQDPQYQAKGKRDPNVFPWQLPEFDDPIPSSGWSVSTGCRQGHAFLGDVTMKGSPICQTRTGNDRDWHAIVGAKSPQLTVEEWGMIDQVEKVGNDER
jgi:hypothetical protein